MSKRQNSIRNCVIHNVSVLRKQQLVPTIHIYKVFFTCHTSINIPFHVCVNAFPQAPFLHLKCKMFHNMLQVICQKRKVLNANPLPRPFNCCFSNWKHIDCVRNIVFQIGSTTIEMSLWLFCIYDVKFLTIHLMRVVTYVRF